MSGLIVDSFAGGGGASTGIEMALGRSPDIAINHDREAVAMHRMNHPATKHYCEDIFSVDPREVTRGRHVKFWGQEGGGELRPMTPTRPLIRYHGGKWKLAPWIISHFPDHRVYVEPFGGGASVLLKKERCYAEIYNEMDDELGNLFRVVRDQGSILAEKIYLTEFSRKQFNLALKERSDDPIEQARRTIIKSHMGFGSNSHNKNTGFRCNSSRSGTTPAMDWKNYPDALVVIMERLRGVTIETRDAMKVMLQHDSLETLHYVDPPYLPESRDKGNDYRFEMTREDHKELIGFLNELKGMVILSGYDNEMYNTLLKKGWTKDVTKAYADGAKPRIECLWMRNVGASQLNLSL
jgi:DNA adenine methylase